MADDEIRMSPGQISALLDAAMSMPSPLTYLDNAASLFGALGRHADARAVALIGSLVAEGEIEIVMGLRAAWRRGEAREPVEAHAGHDWTD